MTYPLSLVLLPALGDRDRVLENTLILPQLELLKTWSTSEQVKDGADQSLLCRVQVDARGGLDVSAFNLEVVGRHVGSLY